MNDYDRKGKKSSWHAQAAAVVLYSWWLLLHWRGISYSFPSFSSSSSSSSSFSSMLLSHHLCLLALVWTQLNARGTICSDYETHSPYRHILCSSRRLSIALLLSCLNNPLSCSSPMLVFLCLFPLLKLHHQDEGEGMNPTKKWAFSIQSSFFTLYYSIFSFWLLHEPSLPPSHFK